MPHSPVVTHREKFQNHSLRKIFGAARGKSRDLTHASVMRYQACTISGILE